MILADLSIGDAIALSVSSVAAAAVLIAMMYFSRDG